MYAYVCVCAFSLHRESPNMILGDKPIISKVVLSQRPAPSAPASASPLLGNSAPLAPLAIGPPLTPPKASMYATAFDNPKALTRRRLPSSVEPPTGDTAALCHRVVPHRHLQSEILTGYLLMTSTDLDSGRSCASSSTRPVAP
jgi:hypothetical protein